MRRVFLIRHGHPAFPLGAHVCLGRTDTPLGPLGRMQSIVLAEALRGEALRAVFSSPLTRCRETAAPLGLEPVLAEELAEQDMGPWDGLDFTEIRARWPELYARRSGEPLLVPPGAETLEEVQRRAVPALERCLAQSSGDIAVTAHASVIQALLAHVESVQLAESRPLRPPYTGCAVLGWDGAFRQLVPAFVPRVPLTPTLAEKLLHAAAPGERVEAHCRAVAAEALRIARAMPRELDMELLCSAALLHDIARGEKEHPALGAAWLRELGYGEAAALVEQHHDLESVKPDEAALLFLADKLVREDRRVGLEARFAASEKRCTTPEARAAYERRLAAALAVREEINRCCGRKVVL